MHPLLHRYLILFFSLVFLGNNAFAEISRIRLVARDNPSFNMTIAFQQTLGGNAILYWGEVDYGQDIVKYENQSTVDRELQAKGMANRFIRLENLKSMTNYYFVLVDNDGASERFYFKTLPKSPENPISMVYGANMGEQRSLRQKANILISKIKPDLVFLGGDFTVFSLATEWQNWLDDWQLSNSSDGRMYPIVPVFGDRERDETELGNLFDIINPNGYYHLKIGTNLLGLYALNSNHAESEIQRLWLGNQLSLSAAGEFWKFAMYHHAFRSHIQTEPDNEEGAVRWAPLFNQYQFDIALESGAALHKVTQPIIPFNGNGSEDGFIVDEQKGVVYLGDGSMGATAVVPDVQRSWTMNASADNQVKWIHLTKDLCKIKAVRTDNAGDLSERQEWEDKFVDLDKIQLIPIQNQLQLEIPRVKTGEIFVEIKYPVNAAYLESTSLKLTWDAAVNGGGEIIRTRIFLDKSLIADLSSSNGTYDLNGLSSGEHQVQIIVNADNGKQAVSISESFFIKEKQSKKGPAGSSYDAEENKLLGLVTTDGEDLALGSRSALLGDQATVVGLVFSNLNIGKEAIISEAYLQFTAAKDSKSGPCQLLIYRLKDNSNEFESSLYNISSRLRASGFEFWSVPEWPGEYFSNSDHKSPDIGDLLRDQLEEQGKLSTIGIVIEGTGNRNAYSYDGDIRRTPKLVVKYQEPITGIARVKEFASLSFYPNPVQKFISLTNPYQEELKISIFNEAGQLLKTGVALPNEKHFMEVEDLPDGNYLMRYHGVDIEGSQRFVKKD